VTLSNHLGFQPPDLATLMSSVNTTHPATRYIRSLVSFPNNPAMRGTAVKKRACVMRVIHSKDNINASSEKWSVYSMISASSKRATRFIRSRGLKVLIPVKLVPYSRLSSYARTW
jgi:hypothetical protein